MFPDKEGSLVADKQDRQAKWRLGEDWLSVIIGLILVVLVWIGVVGRVPWPLFGWFS